MPNNPIIWGYTAADIPRLKQTKILHKNAKLFSKPDSVQSIELQKYWRRTE